MRPYFAVCLVAQGYWASALKLKERGWTAAASSAHSGACTWTQSREKVSCQVAFFSNFDFNVAGAAVELAEDLCGAGGHAPAHEGRELAVVRRGNCSFEVKARSASYLGFAALIVVNEDDKSGEEPFPMGTTNASFQSSIPAVMVGKSFLSQLASCRPSPSPRAGAARETAHLRMYFEKSTSSGHGAPHPGNVPPPSPSLSPSPQGIFTAAVLASFAMVACIMRYATLLWPAWTLNSGLPALSYLTIMVFALALRLGTFRVLLHGTDTSPPIYNHRETDERIFETLVNSVSLDVYDYTVHNKPILEGLHLSRDNYGDSLFIHPPLYVYTCMLLKRYLGLSLPAISLVCNAITMLLLPVVIRLGDLYQGSHTRGSIEFWSLLLYIFCPITHFCSQKIWIDNMLTTMVMLSATIHLWIASLPFIPTPLAMACSGLIFGLLVLNCKITGVLFMPFILGWSMHSAGLRKSPAATFLIDVVLQSWLPMCLGITLAYLPWFLIYWQTTGRLLPNAWPSASMLQTSAFLRMAVAKPPLYYFESLVKFCPLHVVGLAWGAVQLVNRGSTDERSNAKGCVLLLWPCAFLAVLSCLGLCGAGYQTRFLLPCLPATAILGALAISSNLESPIVVAFSAVALAYSAIHCFYYGVLFAPLHADLGLSVFEIILVILRADGFQPLWQKDQFKVILEWLVQYGCKFN